MSESLHTDAEEALSGRAPSGLARAGLIAGGAALLVVAAGIFVRMRDNDKARDNAQASAVPTVHLVSPTGAGAAQVLTLPGNLEGWVEARIFARVQGYVGAWFHDIGDRVAAGTPLGRIETPDLDQQIIQARAAVVRAGAELALAKTTARRWNDLLTTASVSQQEADEKNADEATRAAAVKEAQAALGRLEALKAYGTVRAPFAGIVTAREADVGDLVGPGATVQQPLFGMADEHKMRVYVNVPQQYSAGIKPGLTATLSLPEYPGKTFTAAVTGASGAIDLRSGALQVELVTENPDGLLRSGGYVQVRFNLPTQQGVIVPATALVLRFSGTQVAMVTADGRIHLQPVKLGRDMGTTVQILAGLKMTDKIVDNPPDSITDGEQVRVEGSHG